MNELDSYELSELENLKDITEEDKKKFKVTNAQSANWVFRKIKAINTKLKETDDMYNQELLRITSWKNNQTKKYEELKVFFDGLITEHIMEEKNKDPKYKLSTPYGSAYVKTTPEKWIYDEEVLLKWLDKNKKDLIHIEKTVKKKDLKEYAAVINGRAIDISSGEEIEGVTIVDGEKIAVIKVEGEKS